MISRRYAIVWDVNTGPLVMFRSARKAQEYCKLQNDQLGRCNVAYLSVMSGEDADSYLR